MIRHIISLSFSINLIFILCTSLSGQQNVPFLCNNGLYGLSDSNGNLITGCKYDKIIYHRVLKMYIAQENNKYGLLSEGGKEVTPVVFSENYRIKEMGFSTSDPYKGVKLLVFNDEDYFTLFDTLISNTNVVVAEKSKYETKHFRDYKFEQVFYLSFENGYYKIKRKDGGVNFIKYNGAPVFQKDIINGKALDSTMFAVEGENGKLAIKNIDEELITPFVFNAIEKFDSNYYRVNSSLFYDDDFDTTQIVSVGLIDSRGQLIVDTAYAWMMAFRNDKFIVYTNNTKVGVVGNDHQVLIPFEYDIITPFVDQKVIMKKGDTSLIYDLSNKSVLLKTNEHIHYNNAHNLLYLRPPFNSRQVNRILNKDLEVIYKGDYDRYFHLKPINHILVKIKDNNYVFLSKEGKHQSISKYTSIQPMIFENNQLAFRVELGDSVGLLNADLKEVIHAVYDDIEAKKFMKDSIVVFAKVQGQELYRVFDLQGRELNPSPVVDHAFFFNQRTKAIVRKVGGNKMIIRRNGSVSIMPPYRILDSEFTFNGDRLYKVGYDEQDKAYILDGALYNIIPQGFYILKQPYESEWLKYGLIPVISEINSGVIDHKGNWVIEPAFHGYAIISPDVIGQYDGRPSVGVKHVELFIKKNDHWIQKEFYHVDPIANDSFIKVAKEKIGFDRNVAYGLLDLKGNTVIDCDFTHIRTHDNFITAYNSLSDSTGETSVFDRDGTFLLKIPFRVLGFYSKSHMKILNPITQKQGIMDFNKALIFPTEYRQLDYYPHDNLAGYLSEYKDGKSYTYITSDGDVVCQKCSRNPIFFEYEGHKRIVFMHDDKVTLVDEKFNNITTLSYSFVGNHFATADQKIDGYFTVKNDKGKNVHVNIITGQVMAE